MPDIYDAFPGLAKGDSIRKVLADASEFAKINRPVLIRGERGTGKELLARFIHMSSPRAEEPFLTVNCAAFQRDLLSSELYGHEKGSFTGADRQHIGKLERANGGTLFLDEVGNMPLDFQENILRVIEYQQFERMGGRDSIDVDVRLISATNAKLESMVEEGRFRADLYDRLKFVELTMPSLRQRREEIPELIVWLIESLQKEVPSLQVKRFSREALDCLIDYHWPGNVREFKNVIERLILGPAPELIQAKDLPSELYSEIDENLDGDFNELVEAFKKKLILNALSQTAWNQTESAQTLGMSFDSFRHYYKKFDCDILKKEKLK